MGYMDWVNKEFLDKGERLQKRGELDTQIGTLAIDVARMEGSFDAGFEAGVLASEAGVGRYDG